MKCVILINHTDDESGKGNNDLTRRGNGFMVQRQTIFDTATRVGLQTQTQDGAKKMEKQFGRAESERGPEMRFEGCARMERVNKNETRRNLRRGWTMTVYL